MKRMNKGRVNNGKWAAMYRLWLEVNSVEDSNKSYEAFRTSSYEELCKIERMYYAYNN